MTPSNRAARVAAVTRVLLALAICALLGLLAHDVLLPRLPTPAAPAASAPSAPVPAASPSGGATAPSSTALASVAPVDPADVAAAVAPALAQAPGTASAEVRDAATGEVLYARSADQAVAPASALKILTAVTAVDVLGADRALTTSVVALPGGGATELVLVGGGDALLGAGASDPGRVDGRAGLRTLARRTVAGLRERGVTGPVAVSTDLRLFTDASPLNPAWSAGLVESGNITAVQPLATYGGRTAPGTGEDRIADPAAFAALAFQRELTAAVADSGADLSVRARDVVPATSAPRGDVLATEPVARVESAPVGQQVAYLLAHSENQVAEVLARVAAAADGRPATHAAVPGLLRDRAAAHGVDTAGMRLVDASGLSPQNRVTAHQLAGLVEAVQADPALAPVRDGLPRPGEDSTLAERFPGSPAREAVAAKTGTLDQTVSLTGTVTTGSGRVLAFSIVCSGVDWRIAPARAAIDEAVSALAAL
ncbi:D-alanyl-D-alanine carboxypeptidase/D-alanyl-D-alanine-endopeptidase [Micrococcus porci]|uniref:D-alanyl-D-alanine carboxypeptidase/D-alanyl-D-alanine endopeptidase n=1 Tax=Micrococcus porci TaxID=2856555 RepID=UPI001CCD5BD7|nr:D-alanyl-D-alanine carboxypeptidase/D-alanyl-D-alanine-endopeptidase [Micrococcus porci]UBH24871.1 D-alanyl-D-alanine carboxypeptidase/D-alanyl-D-alanine-endopeptidase [Micrococcus porci]